MVTTRTRINRRSLVITQEMIDSFQTIQRKYRGAESPSDEFLTAFTHLHLALGLYPCTPSPALCPGPDPEGANEFLTACYRESWKIRQRILLAIADARRRARPPVKVQERASIP